MISRLTTNAVLALALLLGSSPLTHGLVAPRAQTRLNRVRVSLFSSVTSSKATSSKAPSLGCWLPVGGVSALQDLTPISVKIANRDYVVWKDVSGKWSAQVDACPHRLAPLSQGRVDENTGEERRELSGVE